MMSTSIEFRVANAIELPLILALQQQNLPRAISTEEALAQGFVTVEHDLGLLQEMHVPYGHTVAVAGQELAGYALTMTTDFRERLPILAPMFTMIDQLEWEGRSLRTTNYVVMGQVCVAKPFRGRGVFSGLYEAMAARLANSFPVIVTEISERNTRSLRAHAKVGFQELLRYAADDGERWVVVAFGT